MNGFRTHYDNLKVARDAPDYVIRAAYKTLSQNFHPDKNPGDAHAAKIMAIINKSYEVLSDPIKRREHDEWIAREESDAIKAKGRNAADHAEPVQQQSSEPNSFLVIGRQLFAAIKGIVLWAFSYAIGLGVVIGVIALIGFGMDQLSSKTPPPPGPKPYNSEPVAQANSEQEDNPFAEFIPQKPENQAAPTYERPVTAPNGEPWPMGASYIPGYKQLNANGLSAVTIDNSQNDSDVFVKLVSIDSAEAFPVRQLFIPAGSKFTTENVSAGEYDVRYRDLDTGGLSRSDPFTLEEIETDEGIQYSTMTMTLYKVRNGNMKTFPLAESEF
jgi:curved DNA-binding protein CbpA